MFIQNLTIDQFGSVSNVTLDKLAQGITVVHGGPGTGKTTLLQFARAILYGFDESTRSRYLPSVSSNKFGGSIAWSRGDQQYTVRRHDDGNFNGHFEALHDGQPGSRVALTETLQGVSAELYSRLFAVDFSRRPELSGLLDEAANCGFSIEGRPIDTAKLQELNRRLATLQSTLASLGSPDQTTEEALQVRRRELIEEIAHLESDIARRHDGQAQIRSQIAAIQRDLDTARQEHYALRKAIDDIKSEQQGCRSRLATAEANAANNRTHESKIRELDAQIERWKGILQEAAVRYEALGKNGVVTSTGWARDDDFEANLAALDSYLSELESTTTPGRVGNPTWAKAEYAPKLQAMHERLLHIRNRLGWRSPVTASCDCERKQLTRTQAELQLSLRYLEGERDALIADSRPSPELIAEIERLKQQLEHVHAKEAELQQSCDAVTRMIRQKETDLADLQQRQHGLATDLTERLERCREELQHLEFQLSEFDRRQTLLESAAQTQRQIREVEDSGESSILRAATNYLRRISGSAFQRIEVTQGKHVWVGDAKGHRLSWGHLSEAVRDKVYLSLCLAIVDAHDQRHAPLPMIWKDVFTNYDSRHVADAAELLVNFAREGRQVLLLTRHEHVAGVFALLNVAERRLPEPLGWQTSDQTQSTLDVNHLLTVAGDTDSADFDPAWETSEDRDVDTDYFLFEDSLIEESPSLSADTVVRLRRLGISTVGELLEASADEIASHLSYAGISSRMVADWQSQALMMCNVARLREYDARILVACGITNPTQLRQIPPMEVRAMIERFADSSEGRSMLLSGTEFELSRVTDWVRTDGSPNGQRSQASRGSSSRSSTRHRGSRGSSGRLSSSSTRHSDHRDSNRTTSRQSRSGRSESATQRTGNRTNAREQRQASVMPTESTSDSNGLRFYLESTSGVVDAPSIGPKSAERLEDVGIVTVTELLAADPNELAGRLKNKRMSAKVIREWQQQTALVCRVPQLRGHDAQILVAVGVTDVEQLAAMDAQDLWAQVEPFNESNAGKRIIRSSKAPDFEEVFHWIEWASQARGLKAA